ncbi:hypothetical protein PINS_up022424 [Pythium insidiosum]|nr:hypothetical protein PINS_up022424 [Pythium insidiosum]
MKAVNALPRSVRDTLLSFLSGYDLLSLRRCSSTLKRAVDESATWEQRLVKQFANDLLPLKGAARYLSDWSLLLNMTPSDCAFGWHGIPVPTPWRASTSSAIGPFTFDFWFCLPSKFEGKGGVFLGAQACGLQRYLCDSIASRILVYVTPERQLHCSLLPTYRPINLERTLQLDEWYHLALVFNGQEERIYLNGLLVESAAVTKSDLRALASCKVTQLGAGYFAAAMTQQDSSLPSGRTVCAGLVDEFRIWPHAFGNFEIEHIARGHAPMYWPKYSLKEFFR